MPEEIDNPLDDDLLRELGLETQPTPAPAQPPKGAAPPAPKGPIKPPVQPTAKRPPPPNVPSQQAKPPPPVQDDPARFQEGLKNLADDMPVQVVAVMGKRSMSLKDVVGLKPGEIIELKKLPQEAIDLIVNGKLVARGELVLVDGKVGIQIKQLVT